MPQPRLLERLLVAYARHFPVDRGKMRVVDRLWRVGAGADVHRVAQLTHGRLHVPCDLRRTIQRQFYFFGTYFVARDMLACWEQLAADASVVFDVGANAGIFSLAALAVRPDAEVHAFEATPDIAAALSRTAALNRLDRLHVHGMAVSSVTGAVSLHRYGGEYGSNDGMNFITISDTTETEHVPSVTLDRFCAEHAIERIDLLKIDVQGQENAVLTGAAELLRAGRVRTIFTELNWDLEDGTISPARETIETLDAAGYRFAIPARHLNWKSAGPWMSGLSDVVATR